jgi:pimeloyl-ACP methyl ester carboxylesterase
MTGNRRLRWLIFALLLYLAFCSVGGVLLADGALHPARRSLTSDDAAAFAQLIQPLHAVVQDVTITTPDAAILRGSLVRPPQPNGEAVLLLHGLGDNRLGMTGYAQLLLAHGFTVLLPDARAHGLSGGTLATYGLIERRDIRQWADLLRAEGKAQCVYGMGESMGAAQMLQSLPAGATFCAVVAESTFANFREIAYDRMGQPFHLGPWVGRTVLRPLVEIAFLRARWKYGLDMEQVSPEDAVAATHVPVLLIHGLIDGNIPVRHSRRIHALVPQTTLWEVPGADHCGAIALAPREFQNRLLDWFGGDRRLLATNSDDLQK